MNSTHADAATIPARGRAIRISSLVLFGETTPTYFIDLIDGRDCRDLLNTKDAGQAKQIAADFAAHYGVRVQP